MIIINNVENSDSECNFQKFVKVLQFLPEGDFVHLFAFFNNLDKIELEFVKQVTARMSIFVLFL